MQRRLSILFALVLLFQTVTSGLIIPAQVAAEESKSIFKDFTVTDEQGDAIESDLPADITLHLQVDWSAQDVNVSEGSSETAELPADYLISDNQSGTVEDEQTGEHVGDFDVSPEGAVTVTFNEQIEEHPDANGTFAVEFTVADLEEEAESEEGEETEASKEEEDKQQEAVEDGNSESKAQEEEPEADGTSEDATEEETKEEKAEEDESSATFEKGAEITENLITDVTLFQQVKEEQKEFEAGEEIVVERPYDEWNVSIHYELELKKDHTYGKESTYQIELPELLQADTDQESAEVTAEDGTVLGSLTVEETTATVTFNENIETEESLTGAVDIPAAFDASYEGPAKGEELKLQSAGEDSLDFPVTFIPEGEAIDKQGIHDEENDTIKWTIDINKNLQTIEDGELKDTLKGDHTFIEDSLQVYELAMNADGTINEDKTEEVKGHEFGSEFPLKLGNMDSAYRVVYETEVNEIEAGENAYENEAALTGSNIDKSKAEASVSVEGEEKEEETTEEEPEAEEADEEVKKEKTETDAPEEKADEEELEADEASTEESDKDALDKEAASEEEEEGFWSQLAGLFSFNTQDEEKHGFKMELAELTKKDGSSFTDEDPLDPKGEFQLKINWELENDHTYQEGDEVSITLPSELDVPKIFEGDLVDDFNQVVAKYVLHTNGTVTLTFTDFVETNSNVQGWFSILATLNADEVKVEDGEAIISPIGEEGEIRIPIDQGSQEKLIEKQGEPNSGYNADEIDWTVTVNKNQTDVTGAQVVDNLPEGTEYKEGSLVVTPLILNIYGEEVGTQDPIEVEPEFNDNGDLVIPLGETDDAYRIEYTTTITDDEETLFENQATFEDDELEPVSADAPATVERGEPINKEVETEYNPQEGTIEWAIEFNYDQKELNDVTLSDSWTPKGDLEFVEDSLSFIEVEIDENGDAHKTENEGLPDGAEFNSVTDGFNITGITTDKPYLITYETKVTDRVLDSFSVSNEAEFGGKSDSSGDYNIGTYYGWKTAGEVDYSEQKMSWSMTFNYDEYPMHNIEIEDELGEGLTLIEDTLEIRVGGSEFNNYTLTPNSDNTAFTIFFDEGYSTNEKIEITYDTKYDPNELPKNTANNEAEITWSPTEDGDSITKTVQDDKELNTNTGNNHWKNGSYNPDTKEITWTIYTNYRENDINDLVIHDEPQGNQKIVTDSVTVTPLEIQPGGGINELNPITPEDLDVNEDNFTVTIGNTSNAYKIEYQTSLEDLGGAIQEQYVNEAEVRDGDEVLEPLSADVGIAKHDTYGEKNGYQDGRQIHWTIDVNLGQQQIANMVLEDTISENQDYLEDTIKVYEASVDGKGNPTKGDELDSNLYELEVFTSEDGEQTFTIEWKETIETAYMVEYSTLFFEETGEDVSNTYKITGDGIEENADHAEGSATQKIGWIPGGGGSGEAGYLIVDKVDVTYDREESGLAGAEFDLIDSDRGNVLKTGTTDENGLIDFGRLLFGEYELHERVVPDGYVTPEERQTIQIDKTYDPNEDSSTYEYRVENYEPVYAVEITKTDDVDSDEFLEGADFGIYESKAEAENNENAITTGTTGEDGKILFDNLDGAGIYYVKEINSPDDYDVNETIYEVEIGDEEREPVTQTVENSLVPGQVTVTKVDQDDEENLLEGAEFDIVDTEGNVVDTVTTDENGVATSGDLRPGDYVLKEVTAPYGYNLSETADKGIEFTIARTDEGDTVELDLITNEVKSTKIQLTKKDSVENSKPLEGAEFNLLDSDNNVLATESTDENGSLVFDTDVKPGTYYVQETGAPSGYISNGELIPVEVTLEQVHEGYNATVEIENDPFAEVILQKQDSESGYSNLAGAEFDVVDENEDPVKGFTNLTTDENGQISVTGLPEGTYQFKEITPPAGYDIIGDGLTDEFTVSDRGETETLDVGPFDNEIKKGSVELTKVDGDTEEALEDVEFTLEAISIANDNDGSYTYDKTTHVTDEDGKISVGDLRPGTYEFTEIDYPEGYQHYTGKDLTFTIDPVDGEANIDLGKVNNYKLVDTPVTKTWDEIDPQYRPESVKIYLMSNEQDEPVREAIVTGESMADEWTYTFTDLPNVNESGEQIEYTIEEEPVTGYDQDVEDYNITNTQETIDIPIRKVWDDEEDQDDIRPTKVTVNLLNDSEVEKTAELSEENDWNHEFTDLPKYNSNGEEINYKVTENTVEGYSNSIEEDPENENGFVVTNEYTPKETSVTISKIWEDESNQDDKRPNSIQVQLYEVNGEVLNPIGDSVEITAADNWTYTWDGLDLNADGEPIEYTVEELHVPDEYDVSIDDENHGNIVITNSYEPETTDIAVNKEWNDADNQDGKRPNNVTVNLLGNGEVVKTTVLDNENDWQHTFKDLPVYENGNEINYKVTEDIVGDYQPKVEFTGTEENPGYTITNNYTPDKTSVTVTKAWEDEDDQDGHRPGSIQVQLYANGEKVGNPTDVFASEDWSYTWENLDANADGEPINYTVEEVNVPEDYTVTVNDTNHGNIIITNSYTPEVTEIPVTKVWDDADNQDDVRPSNVTLNLLNDRGEIVKQAVVEDQDSNEWEYTFTNLPKYENGNEINYRVAENTVGDYSTSIEEDEENGFVVTNSHTPKETSVTVTKGWEDANNQDGIRPNQVQVQLVADGEAVEGKLVTLNDSNNWTHTWSELPENADGEAIKYSAEEVDVPEGYGVSVNDRDHGNIILTNTHEPNVTEIPVTKVWDDGDDRDQVRPSNVTVNLLADGEIANSAVLNEARDWKHTFTNLPVYENGEEINYSVTENTVDKYSTTIKKSEENGFAVTNEYTPEETSVTVTKAWDDANNQDGKRPESIDVQLIADGEATGDTVELNAEDGWTYTWEGLPLNADGEAIRYSVEEPNVPEGYEASVNAENHGNIVITNSYTPELTDRSVTKAWDDEGNQDGLRPDDVTIHLLADDEIISEVVLSGENDWQHIFDELPKYADGEEINYTLSEDEVPGYTTLIDLDEESDVENAYVVTNTHTPEATTISGEKIWDDGKNQDGNRPASITVNLLADGEKVDSVNVTEETDWQYSFEDVPVYEKGEEITYTIEEVEVDGYETEIDGYDITNSYTPGVTEVSGSKIWKDADDQDGIRPAFITVNLLADGEEVDSVPVSAQTGWEYHFEDLPTHADGEEITYSVEEEPIDGYETEIDGENIINTHTPETTEVTVSKVWEDDDDQDGVRPESVTVNLLNDRGAVIDDIELNEENQWEYTFTDLPKYEKGNAINYSVTENMVSEYSTSIEKTETDTGISNVITNSYTPEETSVTVTKAWDDAHNQDGKQPESIEVQLTANGEPVGDPVELNAEDDWTYTWQDLNANEAGEPIDYSAEEPNVPEGYSSTINDEDHGNIIITNSYTPSTTSVNVVKVWNDEDHEEARPESITVNLVADGQTVNSVDLNEENNWQADFTDLDEYAAGENIVYSIEEVEVDGFVTEAITGNAEDGFIITNTPAKVSVGDYVWFDENRDGLQDETDVPLEGVVLTVEDEEGDPVTDVYGNPVEPTTTDENGYYIFENLPIDHTYTVRIDREASKEALDGYVPTLHEVGDDQAIDSSTWEATSRHLTEDEEHDPTLDFGFVVPEKVSVGDYVWFDANEDGLQDDTDEPIEGVVLMIEDEDGNPVTDVYGNPVDPTTTDENGYYIFENLPIDQTYTVKIDREASEEALKDYVPTLHEVGDDNAIDSSTWKAISRHLTEDGEHDPTLDFGFIRAEEPETPGKEDPDTPEEPEIPDEEDPETPEDPVSESQDPSEPESEEETESDVADDGKEEESTSDSKETEDEDQVPVVSDPGKAVDASGTPDTKTKEGTPEGSPGEKESSGTPDQGEDEGTLPGTATNLYNLLMVGLALLVSGTLLVFYRRRQN